MYSKKMLQITKVAVTATVLFGLGVYGAYADFAPAAWRFQKAIVLPSGSDGTIAEIAPDEEVFADGQRDLRDMRIIRSDGAEVPYVLSTNLASYSRQAVPARMFDLGRDGAGNTTFILELDTAGAAHNMITLAITGKNFRRSASVAGSDDRINWSELVAGSPLYDYSLEFSARDTSVRYPESRFRYLRVTVVNGGETPLAITGASVVRDVAVAARTARFTSAAVSESVDPVRNATVLSFDLGSTNLPTNHIQLSSKDKNFSREALLEGSNDNASWQRITQAALFRYDTPQFKGEQLAFSYSEQTFRYFRVTALNKDNVAVHFFDPVATGYVRTAAFQYEPAYSYVLYYGNASARAPEYDLKYYIEYFGSGRVQATLGPKEGNAAYAPPKEPEQPLSEKYPWVLNGLLVLTVAVVALLTFRLIRAKRVS